MWIVLGVVGFLVILITAVTLLPIKIILKNDAQNPLILHFRFLFKTFGENTNSSDSGAQLFKKILGLDGLERETAQKNAQEDGLKKKVADNYHVLVDLIKEVVQLLKHCTVSSLQIKILCAGDDAAQTAIQYGRCCAVTQTLLSFLDNLVKIRKRGCKIDIDCDFLGDAPLFRYYVVVSFRTGRILRGLLKVALAEIKRRIPLKNKKKQ